METKEFIQNIIDEELKGCFADCCQDNIKKLEEILVRYSELVNKNESISDVVSIPCSACGKHSCGGGCL